MEDNPMADSGGYVSERHFLHDTLLALGCVRLSLEEWSEERFATLALVRTVSSVLGLVTFVTYLYFG